MKSNQTKVKAGNRAASYIRASDDSQVDGHSLDAQREEIARWCEHRGYSIGEVYADEGVSARTDKIERRPQLMRLLQDAKQGRFDIAVFHTLDRWSRNLNVLLESVSILSQHGAGLVSITENLDWSTAEGRLVARTLGSFGEFFSDMLSTHVKKGLEERARGGLHLGVIPFVYGSCREDAHGAHGAHPSIPSDHFL